MPLEEHQLNFSPTDVTGEATQGNRTIRCVHDDIGHPNQRATDTAKTLVEVHLDEACAPDDAEPHGRCLDGLACQFCGVALLEYSNSTQVEHKAAFEILRIVGVRERSPGISVMAVEILFLQTSNEVGFLS